MADDLRKGIVAIAGPARPTRSYWQSGRNRCSDPICPGVRLPLRVSPQWPVVVAPARQCCRPCGSRNVGLHHRQHGAHGGRAEPMARCATMPERQANFVTAPTSLKFVRLRCCFRTENAFPARSWSRRPADTEGKIMKQYTALAAATVFTILAGGCANFMSKRPAAISESGPCAAGAPGAPAAVTGAGPLGGNTTCADPTSGGGQNGANGTGVNNGGQGGVGTGGSSAGAAAAGANTSSTGAGTQSGNATNGATGLTDSQGQAGGGGGGNGSPGSSGGNGSTAGGGSSHN